MTGGRIAANFGGIESLGAEIQSAVSRLEGRLATYDQDLNPLKSQWTGEASQAYTAAKTEWTSAINDLKGLLAKTGLTVNDASGQFRDVERRNTAAF